MRTIEIDNELILVEVPKNVTNFEVFAKKDNVDYEIIGLIETPNLNFNFDANNIKIPCTISCNPSDFRKGGKCDKNGCLGDNNSLLKTRIQRKIQDNGFYLVNPISINGQTFSNEHKNEWEQAEERTIKGNLLLIKKLK